MPGSIFTHQNDVTDESQSAFFTEWSVPLECAEADEWLMEDEYDEVNNAFPFPHNSLPQTEF